MPITRSENKLYKRLMSKRNRSMAAHNRKIRRKSGKRSAYEPLKHRMSDVKMWEESGKRYYDLNPEQHERLMQKSR